MRWFKFILYKPKIIIPYNGFELWFTTKVEDYKDCGNILVIPLREYKSSYTDFSHAVLITRYVKIKYAERIKRKSK